MASDVAKIALGVGCGILGVLGLLAGTCFGCAAMVSKGMKDVQEQEAKAVAGIEIEELSAERTSSDYVTIKGRVRNAGTLQVSSLKLGIKIKAKDGTVLDTAYEYPLMGSGLQPGEARQFSRTLRWPEGAETYEVGVESP